MPKSRKSGNATEHALDAVARERADKSEVGLVLTLFTFLTYILQDPFSTPDFGNATEHEDSGTNIADEDSCINIDAPKSTPQRGKSDTKIVDVNTCVEIVEATILKNQLDYTVDQLVEHKRLWDIVIHDKEGNDKDHFFPIGAEELPAMVKISALLQSMLQ